MKKFLLKFLMVTFALTITLGIFTACGEPAHTHSFNLLKSDATNHWYECSCGDKRNTENHWGGEATETSKAVCQICYKEYGEKLTVSHSHTYNTLKFDVNAHWYECSCGDKQGLENHKGGTATETQKAKCSVCNNEYGSLLIPGHTHDYNLLKHDVNSHWYECSCGDKQGLESHKGGTATETQKAKCSVCNEEYGNFLTHSHQFVLMETNKDNMKTPATCKSKALYYHTCECGEKGSTYFEFGNLGNHDYKNGICSECNDILYKIEGTYIYFGKYPQTIKANNVSVSGFANENGYFNGSDGYEYAKVVASPFENSYKFSNSTTITNGTTYYFKVEPIIWKILSDDNGKMLILCNSIINNMRYDDVSNIYRDSEVRAWLNNQFYNSAFSDLQKEMIATVSVDNSASSTSVSSNQYSTENTQDKVFLLSYSDLMNTEYGFPNDDRSYDSRRMNTSDYTRAKGAYISTSTSYNGKYYGCGNWWSRSPDFMNSAEVDTIQYSGNINRAKVYNANYGIVPALLINVVNSGTSDGGNDDAVYTRQGNYIYFGKYPQTIKADSVTVATYPNANGYYTGSDGCEYAKIVANPFESGYKFSNDTTVSSGTTYYFKVEPIKWRILSENDGKLLIVCDSIIANMAYDGSSSNYKDSDVRAWLNNEFYAKAFNDLQKELILTTTVDNSVGSTGYISNEYICENTQDKVFLLSCSEVLNTNYGFTTNNSNTETREVLTSDYCRASGATMETSSTFYGNGWWWLRSPDDSSSGCVRYVNGAGYVGEDIYVNNYTYGIVPALQVKIN